MALVEETQMRIKQMGQTDPKHHHHLFYNIVDCADHHQVIIMDQHHQMHHHMRIQKVEYQQHIGI